jgi:hypothetical protein
MSQRLAVIPKPSPEQTVEDVLKDALSKAPEMDKVLVLWEGKDGCKAGSMDNGMTLSQCLYLIKIFEHWMLKTALEE